MGTFTILTSVVPIFFTNSWRKRKMKKYSKITQREYEPCEMIYILGVKQGGLYIANGCTLYDLLWSKGKLVYVFNKKESKQYYDMFCKYELPDIDSENAPVLRGNDE